jgi:hypothetical protein
MFEPTYSSIQFKQNVNMNNMATLLIATSQNQAKT